MQPPLPSDIITAMTDADRVARDAIGRHAAALIADGICPSCHDLATGSVFPHAREQAFYEDELVVCQLEAYPRGVGHTIVLSREHYADSADMPIALGHHMITVTHAVMNALKTVIGAEKVYLVSMCSGSLSHLHWQLIPRLPGEMIGGRVFASPRGVLRNYHGLRDQLTYQTQRRITDGAV